MRTLRLVDVNTRSVNGCLEISDGVVPTSELTIDNRLLKTEEYEKEAMIPSLSWRRLKTFEREKYLSSTTSFGSTSCAFLKLNNFDFQVLKRFSRQFVGLKDASNSITRLKRTIRRYISVGGGFEVLGVFCSAPHLYTVTKSREKRFIGLHVDNWDKMSIPSRKYARNRICVNLGPGSRYFLYSPMDFIEEAESVSLRISDFNRATELAREFLKRLSFAPILRLRLDPGFAYIAATESIIHDGSTLGFQEPSETLVCFGHFSSLSTGEATSFL